MGSGVRQRPTTDPDTCALTACIKGIGSEAYLIPVLGQLLRSFPFIIRGFHSDNGSEYINKRVAALLHKMLIEEHTKSRSRQSLR